MLGTWKMTRLPTFFGIILTAGGFTCEAKTCYLSSCLFDDIVKWTLPKVDVSDCTQVVLGGGNSQCPCGHTSYMFDKPFVLGEDGGLEEILTKGQSEQTVDFADMTCSQDVKVSGTVKDVFECNHGDQPSTLPISTSVASFPTTYPSSIFQSSTVVLGSCLDRCGLKYMENSSCQCDFFCSKFDDCCSDFNYFCGRNDSCFGRCHLGYKESYACQCNFACAKYNDCCSDYIDTCSRNGNCMGKCGSKYNDTHSCHCNFACTKYRDCCSDYNDTCVKQEEDTEIPAVFCSRYGCFDYDKTQPCQCDPYCRAYNNCCPDFEASGCNTCRQMGGCISYDKKLPCQCNAKCMTHNDCCSDFSSLCYRNTSIQGVERNESSCVGRCNSPFDDAYFTCHCNAACTRHDDCCVDYVQQCRNSCLGRCGGKVSQGVACQCDDSCSNRQDCCDDYDSFCHPRENYENLLPV